MIYRFDRLSSTNDTAAESCYNHLDVVVAECQTAGRGQRGNKWISGVGLNLTLSIVLEHRHLAARDQFIISQITALALCDMLRQYGIEPSIKWTNDIYVGDEKIVGILIENRLCGVEISRSVVGIGINVNQLEFDASLPNPTSMAKIVEQKLNRGEIVEALLASITERYKMVEQGEESTIRHQYHSLLYRLGESHPLRLASGEVRNGVIRGVEASGALLVEWESGDVVGYQFKEVEMIIAR